jgi:hypothetical protein
MDTASVGKFLPLPDREKIEVLVRLSHELTILARDTYEAGSTRLSHPLRLRTINEVQHRISAHVLALLRNDPARYPDDVLAQIILEHDNDPELRRQIGDAFSRITAHEGGVSPVAASDRPLH